MAAVDPTLAGAGLLLLVIALLLGGLAVRHRLAWRIGVRNVGRARQRTVLLVAGLLVGTSIIAGSLVVGDTIGTLASHYTVLALGHTDLSIRNTSRGSGSNFYPYTVYSEVRAQEAGNSAILGVTPEIVGRVSIMDRTSRVPQPNLYLIGVNGNQSSQLGSFVSDQGSSIAGPGPGEVLLDDLAASELNATAGDTLLAYGAGAVPVTLTVQAVVQDNDRGAFPQGGVGSFGSAFVNLTLAQTLEQQPGLINYIAVSLPGTLAERLANAPAVSGALNATLAGLPLAKGLTVNEVLKEALAFEVSQGSAISTLFLVLGLFSIAAGSLLIVGLFLLLGEERKGEMALLRAMGMRGRELVYAFLFEGAIYSAGSALAGTALGVGVGYGLTYAFSILLVEPGLSSSALLSSFTVTPDALALSYVAGFLLTLGTVALASRRASRLNIIRAIRDLPEPERTRGSMNRLAVGGLVLAALGALLFLTTYRGTTALSLPILGGAMVLSGAGLLAVRFLPPRPVLSLTGLALLLWGGLEPLRAALLGADHGGGIYGVFTEGIVLVGGALLLYVFNAPAIARALTRLAGGREERAPVARVGLAYPGRRPGKTAISLAIFALVSFTLVSIAGVGSSLGASVGTLVEEDSGGYTFIAYSQYSAPGLPGFVANNTTLAAYFDEVVPLLSAGVQVTEGGSSLAAYNDSLYAGPAGEPASSDLYTTNHYSYSATEKGLSAAQISQELADTPGVAVVDQSYSSVPNNLVASASAGHPSVAPGGVLTLVNPANGRSSNVTVLGVMTQSALGGVFVGPATAAALGVVAQNIFLLHTPSGVSATRAGQVGKAALFPYGIVLVNFQDAIASSIGTTLGEVGLLEIFVGLGLVVGIAAMGITALRAVSERRKEIGMLRANGFTRGMVVRAFVLEYSLLCLVGLLTGTLLGLLMVWNLTHSPEGTSTGVTVFAMPWASLAVILLVAYGLSMLAIASPARAAANLPPAEAVRPLE